MHKGMKRWMPMFWPEYLADTGHLNAAEHGAYMLLIAHYWMTGKIPHKNDELLRRITRMTPRQWRLSRDVVMSHFGDDGRHKRVDEELAYATEKSRINSTNVSKRYIGRSQSVDTPTPTPTGKERKKEIHSGNGNGKHRVKPRHGQKTKDGRRIWLDRGTADWNSYAEQYAERHAGMAPPTQWNGSGTWFNLTTGDA